MFNCAEIFVKMFNCAEIFFTVDNIYKIRLSPFTYFPPMQLLLPIDPERVHEQVLDRGH